MADPSDLGVTVGDLLQIIEDSTDSAAQFEITQENRRVGIVLTRAGTRVIQIRAAGEHDELLGSPAVSIWIGFGVGIETEPERQLLTHVIDALWGRFTKGEDLNTWMARIREKRLPTGVYAEAIDGVRIGMYPGWFFLDTFVECRIDKDLTEVLYAGMEAEGLCPSSEIQ